MKRCRATTAAGQSREPTRNAGRRNGPESEIRTLLSTYNCAISGLLLLIAGFPRSIKLGMAILPAAALILAGLILLAYVLGYVFGRLLV